MNHEQLINRLVLIGILLVALTNCSQWYVRHPYLPVIDSGLYSVETLLIKGNMPLAWVYGVEVMIGDSVVTEIPDTVRVKLDRIEPQREVCSRRWSKSEKLISKQWRVHFPHRSVIYYETTEGLFESHDSNGSIFFYDKMLPRNPKVGDIWYAWVDNRLSIVAAGTFVFQGHSYPVMEVKAHHIPQGYLTGHFKWALGLALLSWIDPILDEDGMILDRDRRLRYTLIQIEY